MNNTETKTELTEAQKTHWREILQTNFLGAHDLKGKEVAVTIKEANRETVFCPESGKNEDRLVIHFEKAKKPWICNKTNAERIVAQVGSKFVEDWKGKKITLRSEPVKAFGKTTDAVRVKVGGVKL